MSEERKKRQEEVAATNQAPTTPDRTGSSSTVAEVSSAPRSSVAPDLSRRAPARPGWLAVHALSRVVQTTASTTKLSSTTSSSVNTKASSSSRSARTANPQKVLLEYSKFLTQRIVADTSKRQKKSHKEAKALFESIRSLLGTDCDHDHWIHANLEVTLVNSIAQILKEHPALESQRSDETQVKAILTHLKLLVPSSAIESPKTIADSSQPADHHHKRLMSSSLASNSSLELGLAQILADLGPSATRSAATLRDVLANVARTAGPLDEAGLASLLYVFSQPPPLSSDGQQGGGNNNNGGGGVVGLSAALLGSLVPGRTADSASQSSNPSSTTSWNLEVVAQVLSQDFAHADWTAVAAAWDRVPQFALRDANQFRTLLDLYRAGAQRTPPLATLVGQPWRHAEAQLSILECLVAVPPSVFFVPLDDEEQADAACFTPPTSAAVSTAPNPSCWASCDILKRLLQLSDMPSLYRRVRDLFVRCLLTCPEILLCSLVRLQLVMAAAAQSSSGAAGNGEDKTASDLVSMGMQIKTELMRELIPLFFRPHPQRVPNGQAALRRLYAISSTTVMAACFEAWRSAVPESPAVKLATIVHIINIARFLPSPQEAVASLLSGTRDAEYSISVAFVMADNDYLQLQPWLGEKLSTEASLPTFCVALVSYLRKTYTTATSKKDANPPLVSLENVATSLQLLQSLDPTVLAQQVSGGGATAGGQSNGLALGQTIRSLTEMCLSTHPDLRGSVKMSAANANASANNPAPSASSEDVEDMATAYFQQIYTSEQSIGEVVEMLKRFKTSGNTKENEIFACMVHNLFDEYRFFVRYPEKELRITGILFGALIQEQLVSSITLGIALRYVLEALRKSPSPPSGAATSTTSSGKMFKFGMFALEQFKGRLHEWPQYCSHIVQIPHLREGYAALVAEIQEEMTKTRTATAPAQGNSGGASASSAASQGSDALDPVISSLQETKIDSSHVAEFGPKLGRSVTEGTDEERDFEAPPDATLDKVQFLVNNLAPSNVEKKASELKIMLDPKFFGWLGHFLVVKRISTQANFHSLYLSFLDNLGEYGKGLVEAILSSVYHNIGKLLRSPKITTSSSERSYLKNLGIWLGQITLSRNRPIKQIMLDCKELLLQGYETGKLIAVAPFLAKTLEGAKSSIIFRPPNPWVMGLLTVFRSVYNVEGLKMNIKFEVEVLCKNLGIKLEDIPLRRTVLAGRIAPVKERNPDFNIKTAPKAAAVALRPPVVNPDAQPLGLALPPGDESGRTTPTDQQDTVIPNLAAYVTISTSLPQLLQSQPGTALANLNTTSLKRWVPIAVDRAIREIIQPVVERSVTIACITTKEIVAKDFAMESDETKMRKAGQLMVANLAGSLALVTCREPLRSSVSSHLRQLLTSNLGRAESLGEQEQNVIEQCVQICATDNLELGCKLIEKAATEKAVRDVDEALSAAMTERRQHREQTGQPFYDMSIFSNGNQRYPAALPDQLRPRPGGLQAEHFQLYESFQRLSRQNQSQAGPIPSTQGAAPVSNMRGPVPSFDENDSTGLVQKNTSGQQQFSSESLAALTSKLDSAVTALLSAAGTRAREIKLAMLPPDHQIRQLLGAVKQVMPNTSSSGGVSRQLTNSEQELVLGFSQGIFKRLYELSLTEPLRLETLVTVLENINAHCPKLGKDMGTWATYAPTNTETQRRLHRTVLLLLVRSRLLAVLDLDAFLAARTDQGRNHVWVEFSVVFIRTAFSEQIAAPSDFPKLMDMMTRIADGRLQISPQLAQSVRKPILQMLEDTRKGGGLVEKQHVQTRATQNPMQNNSSDSNAVDSPIFASSSLSSESLATLAQAPRTIADATEAFQNSDPPGARQQVTALLESWIRLQSESQGNDKALIQYLQVMQQWGVGKIEEQTERFLRISTLTVVDAVHKSTGPRGNGTRPTLNYGAIDLYCRLLQLLFRHMNSGGSHDQVNAQRLGVLNKILGGIVRAMVWHNKKTEDAGCSWDQRPWYRLFLNLLIDLNKPDPVFEPIRLGMLSVFGSTFHVCQPLAIPGFAFSWLELISHRHFMPNVLAVPGQKGWHIAHQLVIDQFLFLEPYLKRVELTLPVKKLYEGTLRFLLVLLHDYPSFLTSYHLSFCNIIPENCVQLRNIVLSATPKGMTTPDPFTPNLKIDLLPETSQSPSILSHVLGPIESMQGQLDGYLKEGQIRDLPGLLPLLYVSGTTVVDTAKANSLVVYVGAHALARLQNSQISLSRTPDIELFQNLMEFDDRGRYISLNAIANQLRFPSSHTHYFSCVLLYLFGESKSIAVKEQITRVLLERLIVHRPHPWGLLITFIELIKNQRYAFWSFPFTRCATEIEKVFESVARSCMPPGAQRSALVGGEEQ